MRLVFPAVSPPSTTTFRQFSIPKINAHKADKSAISLTLELSTYNYKQYHKSTIPRENQCSLQVRALCVGNIYMHKREASRTIVISPQYCPGQSAFVLLSIIKCYENLIAFNSRENWSAFLLVNWFGIPLLTGTTTLTNTEYTGLASADLCNYNPLYCVTVEI